MSMRCTGFHVQRCYLSQSLWQATVARGVPQFFAHSLNPLVSTVTNFLAPSCGIVVFSFGHDSDQ